MFNPGDIISLNTLVPSKVTLTKLTQNKGGKGRSAFLNYNGKKFSLAVQDIRFPFGISQKMRDEETTTTLDQWTLQMEPTAEQIKVLEAFDEHILNTVNSNPELRKALLGASDDDDPKVSIKLLKSRYTSVLKYAKDKDTKKIVDTYPPKIRCNVPNKDDGFTT